MKPPRKHIPGANRPVRYGHFAEDGLSYVVTATETPRPWCNLLGNRIFGGQFSQCGQGFLWYYGHGYEQVTNWQEFQYMPSEMSRGRLVFVKDRETGRYWTANPQPGETGFRDFWCRVEPGVSTLHAVRGGVEFTMQAFVPWDADVEIWTLTLRNRGRRTRKLAVFPCVEFPTRRIHWYFRARFDRNLQAVVFEDRNYERPTGAFFACDVPVARYDTSSKTFYGPRNDRLRPQGIERELANSSADNEWCVGVLETRLVLRPGEERTFHVFTGRAVGRAAVGACLRRFRRKDAVERALAGVRDYWARLREHVQVDLPDDRPMQTILNCWAPYCLDITTRFRQGTKIGYRDVLQRCRGYVLFDPDSCREKFLEALRHQYASGRAVRGYAPLAGQIDTRDARDGVSWIADTLSAYIKETGDAAILDEVVPYFDRGRGTVWEHAARAVEFLYRHRGRHRMCLIGDGDWNDALKLGGKLRRGESVWLSVATCRALRITADIARFAGRPRTAQKFENWRRELARDVNRHAWDGDWYVYGFTDAGEPVGSKKNREGKIFANVQTWALMEHIVPPRRVPKVWRSIDRYLCTDAGVLVQHPVYTTYREDIGRVSAMPPGEYENASAYAHGTAFYIAALAANKLGREAVRYWHIVHPTNRLNPHSGCEPYGCTTYYAGPASPRFGYAPNSWFTGSASWILFQALEGILGVRADWNGLRIDPAVPPEWTQYRVTRRFRDATYVITVQNPDRVEAGVRSVSLDGQVVRGNLVPLAGPGAHEVDVRMG